MRILRGIELLSFYFATMTLLPLLPHHRKAHRRRKARVRGSRLHCGLEPFRASGEARQDQLGLSRVAYMRIGYYQGIVFNCTSLLYCIAKPIQISIQSIVSTSIQFPPHARGLKNPLACLRKASPFLIHLKLDSGIISPTHYFGSFLSTPTSSTSRSSFFSSFSFFVLGLF